MQPINKHKKAAVYFSAGIGDALLLTPLIKQLKKDGFHVTGIFTSPFHVHELYEHTDLLDQKIIVLSKPKLVWFITRYNFKKFDLSFVNYFAAGKANLLAASKTSVEVYCNKQVHFKKQTPANIQFVEIKENIHDGEQNLRLYDKGLAIEEANFHIDFKNVLAETFDIPSSYIVLQAGAGNNVTPYKIWDAKNWQVIAQNIQEQFPGITLVLLGDKNELQIGEQLQNNSLINLTGKTSLQEATTIIKNSMMLVGSDSGLMHLAAALNKPTFTIWGASNEKLYSYAQLNATKHVVVFNKDISCRPCSAWNSANHSRVTDPMDCPDFKCLKELTADEVWQMLHLFLNQHLHHAE